VLFYFGEFAATRRYKEREREREGEGEEEADKGGNNLTRGVSSARGLTNVSDKNSLNEFNEAATSLHREFNAGRSGE